MFYSVFVLAFTLLSLTPSLVAGVPVGFIYKNKLYVPSLLPPQEVRQNNGFVREGRNALALAYADKELAYSEGLKKAEEKAGENTNSETFYYYHIDTKGHEDNFLHIKNQNPHDDRYVTEPWTRIFGAQRIPWGMIKGWTRNAPSPWPNVFVWKKDWEKKHPPGEYVAPERAPDSAPSSSRTPAQAPAPGRSVGQTHGLVPDYGPSSSRDAPSSRGGRPPSRAPPPQHEADVPSSSRAPARRPASARPYSEEIGYVAGPTSAFPEHHFPPWNPTPGMPPARRPPPPPGRQN